MKIKHASILVARIALFIIYFWFGILKVIGQSPASDMVHHLLSMTMPFIPFGLFIVLFGLFEMLIGILFIVPGFERWAIIFFFLHMITTTLPLFLMSEVWSHMLVPTLEGQYIVKNLALLSCVLTIWASLPEKLWPNMPNLIKTQ
ncbi:hypothetical protein H0W91_03855 [Patescibacteria group bacterium]|nr:hypothetical protein [Patescibacteria group bacterium]